MADVAADGLKRQDPDAYRLQLEDGYIRGAAEQRPAVISVNMSQPMDLNDKTPMPIGCSSRMAIFAALQNNVLPSLASICIPHRLHSYRDEPNADFASVGFSLTSMELYADAEGESCTLLRKHVGSGDVEPRLGLLQFSRDKKR